MLIKFVKNAPAVFVYFGCSPTLYKTVLRFTTLNLFNFNFSTAARPVGEMPMTNVKFSFQQKCSVHISFRGLYKETR